MTADLEIAEGFSRRWDALRAAVEQKREKAERSRVDQEARGVLPLGAALSVNSMRSVLEMMDAIEQADKAGVLL